MKTPIVILGIGKSGLSAYKLLLKKGVSSSDLFTFDEKNKNAQLTDWSALEKLSPGTLVLSPGLALAKPELKNLLNLGWALTSEINIACSALTDEIVIGITGSVGKSTVTSLIGEALKESDPHVFVGGNLGIPFCDYAFSLLNGQKKARHIVLELSSYQLENCQDLKLDFSIITFLSANHLERYDSADTYYKTKCNIGKLTKNFCLLNQSSSDLVKYQSFIPCNTLMTDKNSLTLEQKNKAQLIGPHNLDNLALAFRIAEMLNLPEASKEALLKYKGLPHRLEIVGLLDHVLYINDSKATAMDSVQVATIAALEKVNRNATLHLLLGGRDKNLPWQDLAVLQSYKNIKFYFFGECREIAKSSSQLLGSLYITLNEALTEIKNKACKGDVVLLSPGGTSLDEFKNFEERGQYFKNFFKS